jgi:hypothetical protein
VQLRKGERGNISLPAVISSLILLVLFLAVFDLVRIFVYREETKKASEAICLAVAQDKLFFDDVDIPETISGFKNNCRLHDIRISYDEVYAVTEKKADLIFLDIFFRKSILIRSAAKVKITFPWEEGDGYCQSYYFNY